MTCSDPKGSPKFVLVAVFALAAITLCAGLTVFEKIHYLNEKRCIANEKTYDHFDKNRGPAGFVTRSGDRLLLNGEPFRFSGSNIFWGGLDDDARTGFNYPSPFRVRSALQTVVDMGETVVRCQTCGISTGTPFSVEPRLGAFSQRALRRIDYFIARAQRYGLKGVIPLTDNYGYYLGSYCDYTSWLRLIPPSDCPSAAAVSAFYDNQKAVAAFEKYIGVLLNHV